MGLLMIAVSAIVSMIDPINALLYIVSGVVMKTVQSALVLSASLSAAAQVIVGLAFYGGDIKFHIFMGSIAGSILGAAIVFFVKTKIQWSKQATTNSTETKEIM